MGNIKQVAMEKLDKKEKTLLTLLLETIDYSFLRPDGSYNQELTLPVIDKVKYIKKVLAETNET